MITKQLLDPKSIVVVGASNDIRKPGGKILKNIVDGGYQGELLVTNLKEDIVQEITSYKDIRDLPPVDMAIIAIAAKFSFDAVKILTEEKGTKAFIIISAGFSEIGEEGEKLEKMIVDQVNRHNASLIGPNCIGVLTPEYHGVFTMPIPNLSHDGVDFISGSGATACFIMELGIQNGLKFSQVFSVGNSAQMGVEEILQHMDENFDPQTDSKLKLLYMESVDKPALLLKHARSLIKKGCRIAAIKAGSSEEGSKAASSHTGALASSDEAVEALFRKAGIIRCNSREELITVASVLMHPPLLGKKIAIITHAGGPAVMLTDTLSEGGLKIPDISGEKAEELKALLYPGASISNPIDFLATGNAEQLGLIIDYTEKYFDHIDAMVVIFGTPGLYPIYDVYDVLNEKMETCSKPIYPVLPSVTTAKKETEHFMKKGRLFFPDEVVLGNALSKVSAIKLPQELLKDGLKVPEHNVSEVITNSDTGYLSPEKVSGLLDTFEVPRVKEYVAENEDELKTILDEVRFPLVMKVVGPVHKTDIGGVKLGIETEEEAWEEFKRMIQISEVKAVLIQPMISGTELFIGAKREGDFGHILMAGLGGIFIEVFKDVSSSLVPVNFEEAMEMISRLKSQQLLKGVRGQEGIDLEVFASVIVKVSELIENVPEIEEMDINPLLARGKEILAVDARIKIN